MRYTLLLLCIVLAACNSADTQTVTIKSVIDPITFGVEDGRRIRLIGVRNSECFEPEASLAAASLVGATVRLEEEPLLLTAEDGTLPRYVFLEGEEEIFVNERALESGTAFPHASEDMIYGTRLIAAARYALATGQGLWSACIVETIETPDGKRFTSRKR